MGVCMYTGIEMIGVVLISTLGGALVVHAVCEGYIFKIPPRNWRPTPPDHREEVEQTCMGDLASWLRFAQVRSDLAS